MDDLETVRCHNDTSVTDLVPVRKLKTIKEDENDDTEFIQTAKRVVISDYNDDDDDDDDDGDVEFLKQAPLHPRDRLKCPEKKHLKILPKKN